MAMMARMRSLAPVFIISIGVLFVLFMVIQDSNVMEALGGGRTNTIGSINGDEITYQEYVQAVDILRENQKNQTGKEVPEEQLPQLREQAWDAMVVQRLIAQEIKKFGISVSDDEIKDAIFGENPPEDLRRYFIDTAGQFRQDLYYQFLSNPNQFITDPEGRDNNFGTKWLADYERNLRQRFQSEKLQSLLLASVTVSEADIKRRYIDQNIGMSVEYTLAELSFFPDSSVSVTDEELKDYYDENPDKYKILAQRKLKYVIFPDRPSQDDSSNVRAELEIIANTLKTDTASFKSYVEQNSSLPYSRDTLAISSFAESAADVISKSQPGIIGPVAAPEGYVLYNLVDAVPSKETFVKASHILINKFGSDEANYSEAMKVYDELMAGGNFEKIAKEKSSDPGSGPKGGSLGWFGKGAMVPEFEKAAFSGKIGEIQKPVKSNFGYHIIKVTGKTDNKYVVERIVLPVKQSASTKDAHYNKATDLAYLAEKNGFEKEVELMKYQIQETPAFVEEAVSIPGIGVNKRIVEFAFNNGLNTVSEVFRVSNGYVVVQVSEIIKEGVKPFDEVKDFVKQSVIKEKKYEKAKNLAVSVKNKIKGDFSKVSSVDQRMKVTQTGNFMGVAGSVPTVGRDYAFIAKAQELELNKISEPVKGVRGYYLMKLIHKTNFDSSDYEIKRNTIRDQILAEKRNMYFSQWLTKAKKDADIEDNRYLFFEL
jgi:peptidyl-prolyl cis-trans isomerase D